MKVVVKHSYVLEAAGKKPWRVPHALVCMFNEEPFLKLEGHNSALVRILGKGGKAAVSRCSGYVSMLNARNQKQSEEMAAGSSGAAGLFEDEAVGSGEKPRRNALVKRRSQQQIRVERADKKIMEIEVQTQQYGMTTVRLFRNVSPADSLIVSMDEKSLSAVFAKIAEGESAQSRRYDKSGKQSWRMGGGRLATVVVSPTSKKRTLSYSSRNADDAAVTDETVDTLDCVGSPASHESDEIDRHEGGLTSPEIPDVDINSPV